MARRGTKPPGRNDADGEVPLGQPLNLEAAAEDDAGRGCVTGPIQSGSARDVTPPKTCPRVVGRVAPWPVGSITSAGMMPFRIVDGTRRACLYSAFRTQHRTSAPETGF